MLKNYKIILKNKDEDLYLIYDKISKKYFIKYHNFINEDEYEEIELKAIEIYDNILETLKNPY